MAIEKYTTPCFVLEAYERGEHDKAFKLFTRDFGLVIAHAKSVRKIESKLRAHLIPGRGITVTLVKGKELWRIVGAEEKLHAKKIMQEAAYYLTRFIRGEGTYKALYDRIQHIVIDAHGYDEQKLRLLMLYVILVSLGYADAHVIGAKTIEEYTSWTVADLYTHLLLREKDVHRHVLMAMKEMQL